MPKGKLQSASKASKKKALKLTQESQILASLSLQIEKPKHRLRRHNEQQRSDEDEDFVSEQEIIQKQSNKVGNPKQKKIFTEQDDDDIRKQKQEQQQKKKRIKLKNNQQIDKVMKDLQVKGKKTTTKINQQPKTQLNIEQMFKPKNSVKRYITPQISQQSQIEEQILSSRDLVKTRFQAQRNYYAECQGIPGPNVPQSQLIQNAIRLSLQPINKQNAINSQHVDLGEFGFQRQKGKKYEHLPRENKNKKEGKISVQKHASRDVSVQHGQKKPKAKPTGKSATNKNTAKKQKVLSQGELGGQVVIFTGEFQPYTKNELIELCQNLGAKTCMSFAKSSTILLQGSYVADTWGRKINQDITTTGKSTKALQAGIKVVANSDLDNFFIQRTGKSLQEHFRKNPAKLDGFVQKQGPNDADVAMDVQIINPEQNTSQRGFSVLWTQKHRPKSLEEVIGQASQIRQLKQWLQDWQDVVLRGKKKDVIPQRGYLPSGTINSRAALLSGDPGLGKTTTARLLAQQMGYTITQFNASDIRSKKGVQLLETNSQGLQRKAHLGKNLLIMDQVDGMSKGDRGGITQIINMIKGTTVPIICICNDRQSEKIRSLAGHCLDVKFHKPDRRLIVKRLQEIVLKQGGRASQLVFTRIIQTFQNDMRQILTYLQLLFKTKTSQLQAKDISQTGHYAKDNAVMLTHFDATKKLLNKSHLDVMSIRQKLDCFFIDSDIVPLMVHQNYISSMKKGKMDKKQFHKLVKATDGFVLADLIDHRIRKYQDFSLMPSFGYMSSVYPSEMVADSLGFPQFPSWLGKFSSERKHKRLLKQLRQTIHCHTPCTMKSVRFGQAQALYQQINYLLKHQQIQKTLNIMQVYDLTPTSMNQTLLQLQFNPHKNVLLPEVTTSTKTKLTKAFNRRHEQAKIKGKNIKQPPILPQHHKFNEVLDQMQDDEFVTDDKDGEENKQASNQQMVDEKMERKVSKKTKGARQR